MTILWAWESSAPGTAVAGMCDDIGQAQQAAAEWMWSHSADTGVLEEVRLAIGAVSGMWR